VIAVMMKTVVLPEFAYCYGAVDDVYVRPSSSVGAVYDRAHFVSFSPNYPKTRGHKTAPTEGQMLPVFDVHHSNRMLAIVCSNTGRYAPNSSRGDTPTK
jgi:hypothetical protein